MNLQQRPATTRVAAHCHGSRSAMKSSTAGLSTGLPTQEACADGIALLVIRARERWRELKGLGG
jgi:hypothetical protein